MMRLTVSGASTVCSVERTRWPVSAADSAVCTVSSSRISPTRITSGSWRSTRRRARLKDAVSWPTSRWLMMRVAVAVQELDRVLDRDDVLLHRPVHVVDHRRQRGRLAGAGRAGEQDDPALLVGQRGDRLGQAELVDGLDHDRDGAHHDRDRAALVEGVDAEAPEALDRVREVDLVLGLELGDLLRVDEHLQERVARVLGEQALGAGDRLELTVQTDERVGGDLQVKVGALGRDEIPQRVIEIESHTSFVIGRRPPPLERPWGLHPCSGGRSLRARTIPSAPRASTRSAPSASAN